ncbi:hypothetical protein HYALB_00008440 [Hymenoscyphus albidus]|uniref:Uncharacterized protein n=1 Tax=Hymenoscyphus albidus TaxID=595503 RepID=A0A9N9LP82_9HELO|nr:hypothetical protein HYALB_00008440 [Hymenoscyphus albidus]
MDSEPISLRTLTILLKYERSTSDARFPNVRLINTSFVDLACKLPTQTIKAEFPKKPKTIREEHFHHFGHQGAPAFSTEEAIVATCIIHPTAQPAIKGLSLKNRDLIFNITRGFNGCFHALHLYQQFFKLYPPGRKVSIQLGKEEPILFEPSSRVIPEFDLFGTKLFSVSMVHSPIPQESRYFDLLACGDEEGRRHAILGFPSPNDPEEYLVVDMTSLQYGEVVGGVFGEPYFIGTLKDWNVMMSKCCDKLVVVKVSQLVGDSKFTQNSKECAERVLKK